MAGGGRGTGHVHEENKDNDKLRSPELCKDIDKEVDGQQGKLGHKDHLVAQQLDALGLRHRVPPPECRVVGNKGKMCGALFLSSPSSYHERPRLQQ